MFENLQKDKETLKVKRETIEGKLFLFPFKLFVVEQRCGSSLALVLILISIFCLLGPIEDHVISKEDMYRSNFVAPLDIIKDQSRVKYLQINLVH